MKAKRKWPVIAGIVFIAVFIAALVLSSTHTASYHCEVCVTFEGRTVCRNGGAATRDEAVRSARDTACTDLSSGMTSLMQCQSSAPAKVAWKQ